MKFHSFGRKFLQRVHGTAYKFSRKFVELPTFRVKFQREVVGGEILVTKTQLEGTSPQVDNRGDDDV